MKNLGFNFDNSYERLPSVFFRKVHLNPVASPQLEILNEDLATELGLDIENLKSEEGLSVLSGNKLPPGASSISQAYMGHQFGHLTMLGDGRAILIGEQITPSGERFDLQYKGSGRTPYSRGGDGRAVLGPMLREYIISEGMHELGIPSSRSLSVVLTGEKIIRDKIEKGAILTRVASSHIRVGTFVYAAYQRNLENLKALADYTIDRHFPELKDEKEPYLELYKKVLKLQGELIAKWMLVGFIHGVMNTDNMAISGETIDYGPCAFMDIYDPKTVFSSIDRYGRYAYENQPKIGLWNLGKFGEAIIPLIDEDENIALEKLNEAFKDYSDIFNEAYYKGLGKKLGIFDFNLENHKIADDFLNFLENNKLDYTNTFIDLTFGNFEKEIFKSDEFLEWKKDWEGLLEKQNKSKEEVFNLMKNNNPAIIPRNHWVERALEDANKEDYELFFDLLKELKNPFEHRDSQKKYSIVPENLDYITYCGT